MNIPQLEEKLAEAKNHLARILEAERKTLKLQESLAAFEAVASAQRALAAAKGDEYAIPLDIGFEPEAAVSEPVLLQTDYATILTFRAMRPRPDGRREDAGYGIVEFDLSIPFHGKTLGATKSAVQPKTGQWRAGFRTHSSAAATFHAAIRERVVEVVALRRLLTAEQSPWTWLVFWHTNASVA